MMDDLERQVWAAAFAQRYAELRRSAIFDHVNCAAWADDAVESFRKSGGPAPHITEKKRST